MNYEEPDYGDGFRPSIEAKEPLSINMSPADSSRVLDAVVMLLERDARTLLAKELSEIVPEAVKKVVNDQLEVRIRERIDEILAEGWPKTDSYGREVAKTSLKDFVLDHLLKKASYGSSGCGDSLNTMAKDQIEKVVKKEIDDYAKPKIRESVDAVISSKLNETLKSALGIR